MMMSGWLWIVHAVVAFEYGCWSAVGGGWHLCAVLMFSMVLYVFVHFCTIWSVLKYEIMGRMTKLSQRRPIVETRLTF